MAESTPHKNPEKRRSWWVAVLVLIFVAGAAYWFFWADRQAEGTASVTGSPGFTIPKVPVRTAEAQQGVLQERIRAIGTVEAFNIVTVRSRVEGELLEIYFEDGQFVEAGDVLALVDPESYELRLEQAKGQYKQNKAQLDVALTDLRRFQTLYQQDSLARQTLESQEALVGQLQGAVQSAEASIKEAELQLTYTKIRAPITGKLGFKQLDVGNLISTGSVDGLVTITQTQPIAVTFALPEQELQQLLERLHLESTLHVEVFDRQGKTIGEGALLAVDNQIDLSTGTVRVKASLANKDNKLYPNQFARVSVLLGEQEGLLIPEEAVQHGARGTYVYVVDSDDKVRIQVLELGLKSGGYYLVQEGLSEGEQVVVEGTDRLRSGTVVERVSGSAE
ncbi:MAG TPA: efflux RND transporter periplasmic adaptor subunit [Paenalcaligenes sp.]|nr:efflux RND transporter periplasmic adaptor subunit [Paenalcaligenes sp.]